MLKFKKTGSVFTSAKEPTVPEGLWIKCEGCGELLYKEDVRQNHYVCYKCGKYFRVSTRKRLRMVADKGTYEKWDEGIENKDPLEYPEYQEKTASLKERYRIDEAVTCGKCTIHGEQAVVCVCDGRFLMGSMGYVVGEKITRAVERATEEYLPVIIFTCSGGARMQEGMVSLMQMAKTSAALKRHSEAGLLYVSVLTDPTTGGVTASFAMLGDIILAEPGALVGFAGPRVIEQTIRQKLPEGFQRAEFLLEHGLIDNVVEREDLKETLVKLIVMHRRVEPKEALIPNRRKHAREADGSRRYDRVSAWERVLRARAQDRPGALEYIQEIFTDFTELHGDRHFADDGAVVGGIGYLDGCPVTVIGQQKGKTTRENITRNFGMPSPEGYRKALRLMKQAEKFRRPIICFVDTPGAFCGMEAEERGQGEAIARNLFEMSDLKVPVLSIVIGEGGSGGALALAVGNEVWMMENSTYTILSPEGFASIMWKDASRAPEAAEQMRVTAEDLKELGIIEKVIPEPQPANPQNAAKIAETMQEEIRRFLHQYLPMEGEKLAKQRYERFRNM
ncbi:MAG: acetyl-CoA carboxylase carboxyltransferase subunit beta [Lachnospiraceae bacterium]|jgi:acetyl-CoA carboxylase carboxyl transferase alpha subunit/acetyl-CoA carboxylase carboxyl transferase beta subunit|nr:acetyl-CoA carboxylase carboxyltransferase subunit beta [Lachnospiraceae bacterium]